MEGLLSIIFCICIVVFIAKLFSSASQKLPNKKFPKVNTPNPPQAKEDDSRIYPFKKKQYLMTQTEYKFFRALQEVIKDQYVIIPQVALSRIIEVKNALERYGSDSWYSNFNRINKKSVDYVIFDKIYLSPLLVIELDDYSHNTFNRQKRDDFLDGALKAAGLNILHIRPEYNYDTVQLGQAIFSELRT